MSRCVRPPTPEQAAALRRHHPREIAREIGTADSRTAALAAAGAPVSPMALYALVAAAERLDRRRSGNDSSPPSQAA